MYIGKTIAILICSVSFIVSFAQNAFGCSCRNQSTVLESFEMSELVVTTKLISVEKVREKEGKYDIGYIRSVKMLVEKVYKGKVNPGDILTFGQGGGSDCIWTFDEGWIGDQFLFYVGSPTRGHPWRPEADSKAGSQPMYHAVTCGRSTGVERAMDDLAYLGNLQKTVGRTRLSGAFATWWFQERPNVAKLRVRITGKDKTYEAVTDKDGFYEIYDLPPGDYFVKPALPFGWKLNDYMLDRQGSLTRQYEYEPITIDTRKGIPITIKPKRHAGLDLHLVVDTAVRGRVLSAAGRPMPGVCLKAVSTQLKEGDYRGQSDCTDENGEFLIQEMHPGNYIILANEDGRMSANVPFGILFYPGVSEFKNAGVIRVDAGKHVTGIHMRIPSTLEVVEVTGRFAYSDGKPVSIEWVKFKPDDDVRFKDFRVQTTNLVDLHSISRAELLGS